MNDDDQQSFLADVDVIELTRVLLGEMYDDLSGKVSRLRYLADISQAMGVGGTIMPGGEKTYIAWIEARSSFVDGRYIATVLLCQAMSENILAAYLELGINGEKLPKRVGFEATLAKCSERKLISLDQAEDLRKLMSLRNPLSHYRDIDDPHSLTRRVLVSRQPASQHLNIDAHFAINVAVKLFSGSLFSLSGETL